MEERLQKYMASCGLASRRKCEEIILKGEIKVNGEKVSEVGIKIDPQKDKVEYKGKLLKKEEIKVYIMLNKPEGYITSVKDEKNRDTILDIVKVPQRIYPIGRLDYNSSGLLLLTNDGDIYNKIIHPKVNIIKKYIVEVEGNFTINDILRFKKGIDIGGYITAPSKATILEANKNKSKIEVCISEGKNRQIRRMCSAVNHNVLTLKRISIGNLKLGNLKKGEYRQLTKEEMHYIFNL